MNEISFVSQIRCEHSLRAGSHAAPSHRPVVTQYEYVDTGQWRWTERDARHHPAASSRAQKVREGNASSRAQKFASCRVDGGNAAVCPRLPYT